MQEGGSMRLEAMNISFQYDNGNRKILNNVSMSLESGERVGLKAPSGFGKTTFCKILAGYEKPDHGTVALDGKSISSWGGYNPVQMIWQHPELSVNPRLKMREVLREGDAGGELQRFCIARALGKRTRFILADEISAMLDLITQSQIWGFLLEEVKTRELGLLVVSHSEELLERVCGRVADLRTDSLTVWI